MDEARFLTMSRKELNRLEILGRVLERRLTQSQAGSQLGLSVRQVARLCSRLRTEGRRGVPLRWSGARAGHGDLRSASSRSHASSGGQRFPHSVLDWGLVAEYQRGRRTGGRLFPVFGQSATSDSQASSIPSTLSRPAAPTGD